MKLIAGVVVAVLGLLGLVLGLTGIVPGLTQAGIVGLLLGGLIIGMSFIRKVPADQTGEEMSTPATLVNIFVSPSDTFRSLRSRPRWLAAMILMTLLSVTYANLFLQRVTVERVTNYSIDKTLEMSFLNDEARKQIEAGRSAAIADAKDPVKRATGVVSTFFGQLIGHAILGLLFFSCRVGVRGIDLLLAGICSCRLRIISGRGHSIYTEYSRLVFKGPGRDTSNTWTDLFGPG